MHPVELTLADGDNQPIYLLPTLIASIRATSATPGRTLVVMANGLKYRVEEDLLRVYQLWMFALEGVKP